MFQSKLKTQTHLVLFIWELERFDILSGSSGFRAFTYWLHCALTARLQTAIVLGREIFFFFFWIRNNLASAPSLEKPFSPWPLIFLSGGTQQRVDAVLFISSCLSSHNYPLIFRKGVCRKQGGWERWETDTPPRWTNAVPWSSRSLPACHPGTVFIKSLTRALYSDASPPPQPRPTALR